MNKESGQVRGDPDTQLLDVDEVFRRTRTLDPECSFEAVAQYVREINDMAQELDRLAGTGRRLTPAFPLLRPEGIER